MTTATATTTAERRVNIHYDVAIPMPDGVELAANLYLPDGDEAVPGIMTFIPYHKDGRGGAGYLDVYHRHFAGRGYAVLHVDFRGTGSSQGAPYRTMDGRERLDGHHAVEWMAAQPWCTGDVGVWGISYGGITAMAIAETHPPHLRAIVPIHAPDDNYEAMIVHRGARLMFWPDPHWGASMAASNLMPPLRSDEAGTWLSTWEERLASDPWLFDWHGDPPTPDHWRDQRVDAGQITAPAFVICGWQDAYPDSVHRLWPQLRGPKRLLLGPWKHVMPEFSAREPIDLASQIDRWWDRWLRGIENGVDEEPPVTIFVQGAETWRFEQEWPPARATTRTLAAAAGRSLAAGAATEGRDAYDYDARVGLRALPYDACTGPIPYPQDQSGDDHRSLCYTSEPLTEDLEVTGAPTVRVAFAVEEPLADVTLVAKLCDVAPNGESYLVTFEHVAAARSQPTAPSAKDDAARVVDLELRPTAYRFPAGHRLRLALSGGNFPYLWPSPRRYCLDVLRGADGTALTLPVVGPQEPALPEPAFAKPLPAILTGGAARGGERYWTHRDETSSAVSFEGERTTELTIEPGARLSIRQHFVMTVEADHPSRANTRTEARWQLERPSGAVETRATTITTLEDVRIDASIDLDGAPYLRRAWRKRR